MLSFISLLCVCIYAIITNAWPTYSYVYHTNRAALNFQSCKSKTEREPARVVIIEERTALGQMSLSLSICALNIMKGLQAVLAEKRRRSDQLLRKEAPTKVIITVILSIALHREEADDTVYVMSVNVLSS